MTQEQQEVFDAVEKINQELYKKWSKKKDLDNMPLLAVTFAGKYITVSMNMCYDATYKLPEIWIYNSWENDRIYYEKSDKYESIYKYIKRKWRQIKDQIEFTKL